MSNPAKALQFGLRFEPHPLSLFSCPSEATAVFVGTETGSRPKGLREVAINRLLEDCFPAKSKFSSSLIKFSYMAGPRADEAFKSFSLSNSPGFLSTLGLLFQPNQVFKFLIRNAAQPPADGRNLLRFSSRRLASFRLPPLQSDTRATAILVELDAEAAERLYE